MYAIRIQGYMLAYWSRGCFLVMMKVKNIYINFIFTCASALLFAIWLRLREGVLTKLGVTTSVLKQDCVPPAGQSQVSDWAGSDLVSRKADQAPRNRPSSKHPLYLQCRVF